jgi:soluble lytic murein transglycosylase
LDKLGTKAIVVIILVCLVLFGILCHQANSWVQRFFYPRKYADEVSRYAEEYSVPEYVVYSVIMAESGFDKDAVSSKGARGLMQLMPETYEWLVEESGGTAGDILDPEENIKYGTYYLSMLYKKYGDWTVALCAYNAGTGNVDKWLSEERFEIKFAETQIYVNKLEVIIDKYKSLYYG